MILKSGHIIKGRDFGGAIYKYMAERGNKSLVRLSKKLNFISLKLNKITK